MLKSYLLTLYRSVVKHRLFSALNILGLAVGMAVFLVLTIAVHFENSYDRWIPDAEQTYRVSGAMRMTGRPEEVIAVIPGPVLPMLRTDFGQIEAGVRMTNTSLAVRRGQQSDYEEATFADASFFDVFDLPLAAGSKEGALADTASLVISESIARKYFGRPDPVGERLTLTTDGVLRDYRVAAVLKDLPENTHLKIDMVALLDKSVLPDTAEYLDAWNATNYHTYIRLPDAAAAQSVQSGLEAFLQRRSSDTAEWMGLELEALPDVHFNTSSLAAMKTGVDRRFVTMLQIIGVLTLVLAVINYVNLSTARAVLRAREVALRKVFGATRGALVAQFLVEAVLVSLFAGLIALALVELSLPLVNAALGTPLELNYGGSDGVLPLFAAIVLVVGLAAGFYPAMVISRFEPAGVLAAARAPGGGRAGALVREVLVVTQFTVSIALLICTGVVLAQSAFVRRADLGFQREGLILIKEVGSPSLHARRHAILDAVKRTPGVVNASLSDRNPGDGGTGRSQGFTRQGMQGEPTTIAWEPIGEAYFETYGVQMLAGRKFNLANRLDDRAGLEDEALASRGLNIIINETATKNLEFARPADAVNAVISGGGLQLRVVGVAKDVRFGSPKEKVPPLIYVRDTIMPEGRSFSTLAVRYRGDPRTVLAGLEASWRRVASDYPFEAETVETSLDTFYRPDEQRSRLVTLGAGVAALIGCLGLYGLAAFSSERRTKEIGVRKVLGASSADVFRLLVGQFLRPVVIANLIAWPLAFVLMREWLGGFDQRVELTPVYFIAATALALLVALLTVAGQALRVARCDPGTALRYE